VGILLKKGTLFFHLQTLFANRKLEDGVVVTHLNATCPQRLSIISPKLIEAVIGAVFCKDMPYHSAVRTLLGLTHDMHVDHSLFFVSLLWCEPGAPRQPYHRDCGETGTEVQVFIYPDVSRNDVHWEAGKSYHFTPMSSVSPNKDVKDSIECSVEASRTCLPASQLIFHACSPSRHTRAGRGA
jgi:hypothetical protein